MLISGKIYGCSDLGRVPELNNNSFVYFIFFTGHVVSNVSPKKKTLPKIYYGLKGNGGLEKKKNYFAAKSWIRSLTCQKSKN